MIERSLQIVDELGRPVIVMDKTGITINQPDRFSTPTFNIPEGLSISSDSLVQSLRYLGTIYNRSNWVDLTDFTLANVTPTIVASKIQFTGGDNGYTQTMGYNYLTDLAKWKITGRFLVGTKSGTSYGMGLGCQGFANGGDFYCKIDMTTAGTSGFLYIYSGTGASQAVPTVHPLEKTSATAVTISSGDYVYLSFERDGNIFTCSAFNDTTHSAEVSVSYQMAEPLSSPYFPILGRFAVINYGGTQILDSLLVTSNEAVGLDILVVGDSRVLHSASKYQNAFPILLQKDFQASYNFGAGEGLAAALNRVAEIISLKPKNVVMATGINDFVGAVWPVSARANYASFVDQLEASGIKVWHLLPIYSALLDQSDQANWLTATYTSNRLIDTKGASYATPSTNVTADGTHPNDFYHGKIAQAIKLAIGLTTAKQTSYISDITTRDFLTISQAYYSDAAQNLVVGVSNFKNKVTSGVNDVSLGLNTLNATTTGSNNVAIGVSSLAANTTGGYNIAVGTLSLPANTTGNYNIASGYGSLNVNTTGNKQIALGYLALSHSNADSNIAIGYNAQNATTSGIDNLALGESVLQANTTGSLNVGVGQAALLGASTASNNTAIGCLALSGDTTGGNNTAIGYSAGSTITTGTDNLILGKSVGSTVLTTGARNILLGNSNAVTTPAAATNDYLNIGNIIYGDMSATKKLSFYSVSTPVAQAAAITAPTGGATIDAEARTAINSIRTALSNLGLTA